MSEPLKICIQRAKTRREWDAMQDDYINCAVAAADRIEKLEAELVRTFNNMMKEASRIEKLEAALARIAKYDLQAIAMDALRPGERIRETLNTSSECVNETGES